MKPCTAHGSLRIDDVTERVNALDHGDDNRERFASLAMLFGWLAQDMGLAQYWLFPGWGLLGKILLITGAAGLLSWMAGSYLQLARKRLVAESLRLLAQMPALIIFGGALGRQLDGLQT